MLWLLAGCLGVWLCGSPLALAQSTALPGEATPDNVSLLREVVQGQVERLNLRDVERVIGSLEAEVQQNLPSLDIVTMIFQDGGNVDIDLRHLVGELLRYFLREVVLNLRLLGQLLLLMVLCSCLEHLQVSGSRKASGDLVIVVSFLVLLFLAVKSFQVTIEVARRTIDQMVAFMQAVLPLMTALLAAAGGVSSAVVLHPVLLGAVVLVGTLVKNIVFPLALIAMVLAVVGNMAKDFPVGSLAGLVNKAAVVILGLLCTGFLGVLSVKGALAPVVDGVGLKTAKFLAGNFVPVIGGVFSGAVEVIAGGSVLIKGAIGAFGLVAVAIICAFPLLKLASVLLIYKIAAALAHPMANQPLAAALDQMASALGVVLAAVVVTAVMFFVAITVVISAGNMPLMMQ